jgi:hypothetical protein
VYTGCGVTPQLIGGIVLALALASGLGSRDVVSRFYQAGLG